MGKQAWLALIGLPLLAAAVAPLADGEAPGEAQETPAPAVVRADLEPAIDALFEDEGIGETRALIVLQDGEIVAERYAPGFDADMRYVSWSMAKSVTAILIGFLVADGRLDLDARAPIPEWHGEGDPRRAITLRHLLHMSAGLDHVEVNEPVWDSRTNEMLFTLGSDDMAGYAVDRELEAAPGSHYEYSSVTSVILSRIIADALTDSTDPGERAAAFRRFAEARLIGPARVPSLYFEFDARGTQIGGSLMHATARDWARLGELMRTGRGPDGRQIVDPEWRAFMLTPAPTNPEYGGHIWLNRPGGDRDAPVLFPDAAPNSIFSMIGHMGQYVVVSPEQGRVVVRLGHTTDDERAAMVERIGRLFAEADTGD